MGLEMKEVLRVSKVDWRADNQFQGVSLHRSWVRGCVSLEKSLINRR